MKGNIFFIVFELLKELLGVGKYIVGVIVFILFGECIGIVDGNVIRVLLRFCGIGVVSFSI